jgi:hypothetical protein
MEKTMRRTIGNSRKIRTGADVRLDAGRKGAGVARQSAAQWNATVRHPRDAQETIKKPSVSSGGRHSHKSETRISTVADFARDGKQKKKALPLSLLAGRRRDNHAALEKSFADFSRAAVG